MNYKVGDRVKVKSLQWFNENSDDDYNVVLAGGWYFSKPMSILCGKELIIEKISHVIDPPYYIMKDNTFAWTDEMIEGLVEEETKPKYEDEVNGEYYSTPKYLVRPNGYQFVDENGNVINAKKIVLEKKKKEYPKTYGECCKVLGIDVRDLDILDNMLDTTEIVYRKNLDRLLNSFRKLLICRDAYWKIAGEEMGLGKPWEPSRGSKIYLIGYILSSDKLIKEYADDIYANVILSFPTEEMRDAFYENFKEVIEHCKELL